MSPPAPPNADRPRAKRLLQLDVLRGLAILLVLGAHWVVPPDRAGWFSGLAEGLVHGGGSGVYLFFVLSGYLIGGLLFQEIRQHRRLDARRFLIRRGLKIWPSYYAFLAFLAGWMLLVQQSSAAETARAMWPAFLHIQNYLGSPVVGHPWTLAVEEHFYLGLPLLLLVLVGFSPRPERAVRGLVAAGVVVILLSWAGRLWMSTKPYHYLTHQTPTHLRLDGLFFGVLLAYASHYHPRWLGRVVARRLVLALVGLVLVLVNFTGWRKGLPPWAATVVYGAVSYGYGCLLLVVVHTPLGAGWLGRLLASRVSRMVAWIGFYSYPIYLWHSPLVLRPIRRAAQHEALQAVPDTLVWLGGMSFYVAAASLVGYALSKAIETPVLKLRDRWFPSESRPLAGPVLEPEGAEAGQGPEASASRPGVVTTG